MKIMSLGSLSSIALLLFSAMSTHPSVVRADSSPQPRSASGTEQNADIALLASRLVEKLKIANIKTVAIRPFHGSELSDRTLGYKLSDSFTSAVTKTPSDIHILDRARLLQALREKKWMSIDLDDPEVFRSVAVASGVDAVIHGKFKVDGKFLELSLEVVNVSTEENIAELKTNILMPQDIDNFLDVPVQDPVTGVYLAGSGGVTAPSCTHCPQPEYFSEARRKQIRKAQHVFRVTVRSDGRAVDIRLLKPAGLDENCRHAATLAIVSCTLSRWNCRTISSEVTYALK